MDEGKKPAKGEVEERFIIRMPTGMRDKIKALASEGRRSLNSQYVLMLQSFLDEIDRENYESSAGLWDALAVDVGHNAQSSAQSLVGNKTLREMKERIAHSLFFLRDYLKKTETLFSALETKHLTMQLAFWKQEEKSISGLVKEEDLASVAKEIEALRENLQEARRLLNALHPVDPAHIKSWNIVAEDMLPEQFSSLNESHRIERELTKNFSTFAFTLFEVHMLAKKDEDDLYARSCQ